MTHNKLKTPNFFKT